MKKTIYTKCLFVALLLLPCSLFAQTGKRPWMDDKLPVARRVELVLAAMTPEEKIALLTENWGVPAIPRLGIPAIKKVEAVHGFSYGSGATIFPQALALAATWNKGLAERVAHAIGEETVAAGAVQAWSPLLDVAQDARWGRCEESFGEDPVLVSYIGGAWIKGYQSLGLLTTPKHFVGHGAPLGGRDSHDIGLSEREMREIHLVPFRYAIEKYHCQSIMAAYSAFLGEPIAKCWDLLQGILREEWGFNGYIVSDCGAIGNLTARKHYTAHDMVEAANEALAAGIAVNCGDVYGNPEVLKAVEDGRINRANLDKVCGSLLAVMFRNGLFDHERSKTLDWNKIYPGWQSPAHVAIAREAARQSIVLLKNKDALLPLSKDLRCIAVIGPGADDLQIGDYSPTLRPGQLKSVLTGIKAAVSPSTQVLYEKGCGFTDPKHYEVGKAVAAAEKADAVVLVLGDCSKGDSLNYITSGENHDYATLELPGRQLDLLKAVCATGKPVILFLQSGRPYVLTEAAKDCAAILVNWFPGQEGGYAAADVLFGDYNPAGRLPMTFPRHVGQLPDYYNFKTSGRRYEYADLPFYPLYRFGYGLSYTRFNYSHLQSVVLPNGNLSVSVDVKNTGKRKGDEVVQLYVTDMYASVKTRITELKDFARITLEPGAMQTLHFELKPYQLSLLNDKMDRVVEPGEFKILVGGVSPAYKADDRIKDSLGYPDSSRGLSMMLDYPRSFAADFTLAYGGLQGKGAERTISVKVSNKGNLTDVGKVYLYIDGLRSEEFHHYELAPGQSKMISFVLGKTKEKHLDFTTKYKNLSISL